MLKIVKFAMNTMGLNVIHVYQDIYMIRNLSNVIVQLKIVMYVMIQMEISVIPVCLITYHQIFRQIFVNAK